jgi:hypothetical protein
MQTIEDILLRVRTLFLGRGLDKATLQLEKLQWVSNKIGVSTGRLNKLMTNQGWEFRKNTNIFDKNGEVIGRNIRIFDKFTNKTVKQNNALRTLSMASRRFRMELLSVGFLGASVAAVMWGMLNPAMQMVGIFDILNLTLGVVFLPIALLLLNILLPIALWFISLPEPIKLLIGALVLGAAIVGTVVGALGFLGLGLIGVAIATGLILGPLLLIIGVVVLIIAIVIALYYAYQTNFAGIRDIIDGVWQFIKMVFDNIWGIIQDFINMLVAIATLDAQKFGDAFNDLLKRVYNLFVDIPSKILQSVGAFVLSLVNWAAKASQDFWTAFINWFQRLPGFLYDIGVKMIQSLISAISGFAGSVGAALWNLIPQPFKGWISGAASFVGGVASGISAGVGRLLGFQEGGIVPGPLGSPVPAIVHGGEEIIPHGRSSGTTIVYNPIINIDAKISSDFDIEEIARKINESVSADLLARIR